MVKVAPKVRDNADFARGRGRGGRADALSVSVLLPLPGVAVFPSVMGL